MASGKPRNFPSPAVRGANKIAPRGGPPPSRFPGMVERRAARDLSLAPRPRKLRPAVGRGTNFVDVSFRRDDRRWGHEMIVRKTRSPRRAFTLVELLVVIAIFQKKNLQKVGGVATLPPARLGRRRFRAAPTFRLARRNSVKVFLVSRRESDFSPRLVHWVIDDAFLAWNAQPVTKPSCAVPSC